MAASKNFLLVLWYVDITERDFCYGRKIVFFYGFNSKLLNFFSYFLLWLECCLFYGLNLKLFKVVLLYLVGCLGFLQWYEGSFHFYCYREIIESVLGFSACLVLIIDFLFFFPSLVLLLFF